MRRLPLLVLLVSHVVGAAELVTIGDWSCREWSARRSAADRVDPPQMWLSGLLTGMASATETDVLAITDAIAVFAWMDGFCARQPGETVGTGGVLLFEELKRRLPSGPPRLSRNGFGGADGRGVPVATWEQGEKGKGPDGRLRVTRR